MDPEWLGPLLAAALGAALSYWLIGAGRRLRQRRRARRAARGEENAAKLLRAAGYRIEQAQAHTRWELQVDGQTRPVDLRADYLVSRAGKRYVAEVKTGRSAPRLENAATRRQLLEYRLAYAVAGALLVDMEAGRIHQVEFPTGPLPVPGRSGLGRLLLAALLGAQITYLLLRH